MSETQTPISSGISIWLNKKNQVYDFSARSKLVISALVGLIVSLAAIGSIYFNVYALNRIDLGIINLGGILLIISICICIQFFLKLLKELLIFLSSQKNWIIIITITCLAIVFWQAYTNIDKIKGQASEYLAQTDLRIFDPITWGQDDIKVQQKPISKPVLRTSDLEKEIHAIVNEERKQQGLASLSWDADLASIARSHSNDMAINNYFNHSNLEGQGPIDRGNAAGYPCRKEYGDHYTQGIAENLFLNSMYNSVTYLSSLPTYDWSNQSEIAKSTVEGWMNSPGHRKNILTSSYDAEGIGVVVTQDYKIYITENFC